ncbi:pdz domain containing protein, putative [Trypanosoma equiperdum]|uniref:Uncharacterized protein n=2 Tax=Trypanozoon TaxID=39700 RepID=Q584U7_TRYB2|nr:hypothetical protein, conserved [Trypanosoma brucei brucei TREU927]AAX80843.1 hypothetical protein, conserved [Trypanosoma brucei]AAZ11771.1 hypothetical protein, conserved [Trypanosoma brucei brucei TREU927]SCU72692.1 pdz domain containing protein, putative [Trypanosoma equiperdum]
MGLCNSKSFERDQLAPPPGNRLSDESQRQGGGYKNHSNPAAYEHQTGAEQYLKTFLRSVESVLSERFTFHSQEERDAVSLSFMNSCAEITRTKFRLKMETVVEIISKIAEREKLKTISETLPSVKEFYVDAGFFRLLNTWMSSGGSPANQCTTSSEKYVTEGKDVKRDSRAPTNFASVLIDHLNSASLIPTMDLFPRFAEGGEVMTLEQFGKFVTVTQGNERADAQIVEKYNHRFGGIVHRYNFNTYLMGLMTNNALDPSRTTSVWQDMTQPLTRYLIKTIRIESESDLQRALSDNSRAFVLKIKRNSEGVLCSGSCPLTCIIEGIKTSGFSTIPYPIILCLSPPNTLPVQLKDELAEILSKGLGTMLAKGLMFEGAIISDPKFSPAAQRKKVLVLGYQSPLKPFVGSLMADMNRDGLGVRVTDVVTGTPAAKAGVSKDDWFTHINGEAIINKQHLREQLEKLELGEEFTLKRENLDELKIVVGGAVDREDKSESAALSDLLFLKYAKKKTNLKPWEVVVLTADVLPSLKPNQDSLDDHFAFFSDVDEHSSEQCIGIATQMGVQLIDHGNSREGGLWAQGRFVDNGRSGYLIKNNTNGKLTTSVSVDILAGPQEIKGLPLSSSTARVYGAGKASVKGSKIVFEGCNETTVAVIDCKFVQDSSSFDFTTAFPPLLLRSGYRVLRLEQTGGLTRFDECALGAHCLVSWNKAA